jgi:hypothetical protein
VTAFVLAPPGAQAAQYNLTTAQVWAVQQYLEGLVRIFVAPAFQDNVLGPLGGLLSGGLVVKRTVRDWIDGVRLLQSSLICDSGYIQERAFQEHPFDGVTSHATVCMLFAVTVALIVA